MPDESRSRPGRLHVRFHQVVTGTARRDDD